MRHQATIREEELKNRVAALLFGKYDCTRIVGNIDFCVSFKRRDPRQMTLMPDVPILCKDRKNLMVYMRNLLEKGRISRTVPDKPKSKNQRYISIGK